jgi:LPS sulfotransferase NodH
MPRYQSYIICTSPRSGSTLLCKLLAATGKSGNPGSHFHDPSIADWQRYYGLSADHFSTEHAALTAIFDAARAHGTGNTGMFGLRLQKRSFSFFMQQMDILHPGYSSDLERIQAAFDNTLFIHLTRANKLDQAISLVKATQTGLWHKAADGTELERLSAPQEPFYDADEITRQLNELSALDEAWKVWFDREKLQPLQISYDELSGDPAGVLAEILDELGLNREMAYYISPQVAKLADATNRIWAERFLAERDNSQHR